jgi:hypothetical protein
MTFRDFSKVLRKETENLSEHNFSLISNKDIDDINEISIFFTEEKKSEVNRESLFGFQENYENQNSKNISENREMKNDDDLNNSVNILTNKKQTKIFMSEMDDFLKINEINKIKI